MFSSLKPPTTFDGNSKVISGPFFTPNFNLLSCKLDNFTLKKLYWVLIGIILKQKRTKNKKN